MLFRVNEPLYPYYAVTVYSMTNTLVIVVILCYSYYFEHVLRGCAYVPTFPCKAFNEKKKKNFFNTRELN